MTLVVYNYRCIMVLYLWEFLEQGFRQKIWDLELNWRPGPITLNKKVQTPHCQRQQSSFSTADKRSGSKICMFVSHIHYSHWNYSSEIHRHWQPPQYHQVNVVISENSSTLLWLRTTRFKCKCKNLKERIRWQQCAARWNQKTWDCNSALRCRQSPDAIDKGHFYMHTHFSLRSTALMYSHRREMAVSHESHCTF